MHWSAQFKLRITSKVSMRCMTMISRNDCGSQAIPHTAFKGLICVQERQIPHIRLSLKRAEIFMSDEKLTFS